MATPPLRFDICRSHPQNSFTQRRDRYRRLWYLSKELLPLLLLWLRPGDACGLAGGGASVGRVGLAQELVLNPTDGADCGALDQFCEGYIGGGMMPLRGIFVEAV